MEQITKTINSRENAVACEDEQEVRILQLARLLDEKAKMITAGAGQVNENMLLAMVGLLLAGELSELRKSDMSKPPKELPVDNSRLLELDASLAEKIKTLSEQIKSVASQLNLM